MKNIHIKGARQHNLKNVDLKFPKNKLIVFTGVSGSGKSSMAFDTIYAEGQRRYVESLSTYARQFLGIMNKPDVDFIEGLSPSVSIDQKTTSKNPRSTVGTITEIYDYLRLLYSRIGHPHCPICNVEISSQSLDEIVENALNLIQKQVSQFPTVRYFILSPVVKDKKGEFSGLLDNLKAKGYKTIRIDGQIRSLSEDLYLLKTNKHSIDVVIDKISFSKVDFKKQSFQKNLKSRITESFSQALKLSDGLVILTKVNDKSLSFPKFPKLFEDHIFSEKFACPVDNIQIPEIEPRTFSFNSPHGACEKCSGIGYILKVDPSSIFAVELSITEGAIVPFANMFDHNTWYSRLVLKVCEDSDINYKIPIKNLSQEKLDILLFGTENRVYKVEGTNRFGKNTHIFETFQGIISELEKRYKNTQSDMVRDITKKYMVEDVCPECNGTRLKKESLGITIDKHSIHQVNSMSIEGSLEFIKNLSEKKIISEKEKYISEAIRNELIKRLTFLMSVGLEYLTLARSSGSLSGGEAQRIRLASQIGSGLSGVLYVLDEPTIGLHQRDNGKLIRTLKKLRDLDNTVIVVEHDREMINNSDNIVDFGPGAGKKGGDIVFNGTLGKFKLSKTLTSKYLNKSLNISIEKNIFPISRFITITGCTINNLKNIDVKFPLSQFVVITGVSGSGKSSLLVDTLYPALFKKFNPNSRISTDKYKTLQGYDDLDKVILVDQSPIGKTPRSNPATYTKVFDLIRQTFSETKDAKVLGFKKGQFSFNLKGGRCEACEGQGEIKIEMQFLSDVWVMCEVCKGKRYNSQTLDIQFRGKNIYDVLKMSVAEAREFFHTNPKIIKIIDTLILVGLDYIELGQPATTLSGGEAQRIKLAHELSKKDTGKTVYILDEPTTGLHFHDVQKLLNIFRMLVRRGNSVYVIEHNTDVIKNADYIIDMGPDGGEKGGEIIAKGKKEELKKSKVSYTSKYI